MGVETYSGVSVEVQPDHDHVPRFAVDDPMSCDRDILRGCPTLQSILLEQGCIDNHTSLEFMFPKKIWTVDVLQGWLVYIEVRGAGSTA